MPPAAWLSSVLICKKGRIVKLLPSLQKAIASGVKIEIHTRTADSRELSNQESVYEAIEMMEQTGIVVHTHKELNQRYAVVDESIVWYGGVDFLAFGRKDTDVLRFKIRTLPVNSCHFPFTQKANSLSWKMFLCRGSQWRASVYACSREMGLRPVL